MALIKCTECKQNISDKAKDCIHCGAPIEELYLEKERKSNLKTNMIVYPNNDLYNEAPTYKILLNEDYIMGKIAYGEEIEFFDLEDDGVLTFKYYSTVLKVKVYADRKNCVYLEFDNRGELIVSNLDYYIKQEKNNLITKKETEEIEMTSSVNSENVPSGFNYAWIISVLVLIGGLWYFGAIDAIFSGNNNTTTNSNRQLNPVMAIENVLRREDSLIIFHTHGSTAIGNVTNVSCSILENDEHGRYLLSCNFRYNPREDRTIMLDQERSAIMWAAFKDIDGNTFLRQFGNARFTLREAFKESVCWGSPQHSTNNFC